jgi:Domain of unknown function (DUF4304)
MITTADFKKQIAKPFGHEMRQHNFKGTGLEYFQKTEDFLIAVSIDPSRWGGSCSAGFAVHPKQIDKDYDGRINLTKLKIYHYEFKMSLTNYGSGEWWNYSDQKATNLETLLKIITSIKGKAFPVIEQFKTTPNILEKFDVSEMDNFHENWTKKTGVTIATTDIRFAWAMVVIFESKNLHKAKQFARWGLANLTESDRNWFGKKDLKRVVEKNKKE